MAELTPRETLELHELISFNSSDIKNLTLCVSSIRDDDIKNFMDSYIKFKESNLQAIQKLIENISQNK